MGEDHKAEGQEVISKAVISTTIAKAAAKLAAAERLFQNAEQKIRQLKDPALRAFHMAELRKKRVAVFGPSPSAKPSRKSAQFWRAEAA